jgi:ABC-type dipeptide/oligopeptide/nickel transport system permease component
MLKYLGKRLRGLLTVLVGVGFFVSTLTYLIPGDPATIILGQNTTPELRKQVIHELGLDLPPLVRFATYWWNIFHGNFGTFMLSGRPVMPEILRALPCTLVLASLAMLFSVLIGGTLGILSILFKDTLFDQAIGLVSAGAVSVVQYVAALVLVLIFSVALGWLPSIGVGQAGNPLDQIRYLILPVIALSISWIGYIERIVREVLAETLFAEYVKTAKSFGIPRSRVLLGHCLRNAVKPLVTVVAIGWGSLLSGSFFVEAIFGRTGLGSMVVTALQQRDYYVAQAGIMVIVALYISALILAEVINGAVDPRIRLE